MKHPAIATFRRCLWRPAPALQTHLSCLANPWAGLRQPDARWLRSIGHWPDDRVAVTWRASALCLLAGASQLTALHAGLAVGAVAP